MAFPTVTGTTINGRVANGSTTASLTIPTGYAAGDLVIFAIAEDKASTTIAATGWTQSLYDTNVSNATTFAILSRIMDGTEGSTISVARATTCALGYVAYLISASSWHGTSMPEGADTWFPGGNQPDPPSLTPSWGADDTLWIAGCCWRGASGGSPTYPANYSTDNVNGGAGGIAPHIHMGDRQLNATSEDPGAFNNGGVGGFAFTLAVRPAAAGGTTYNDSVGESGSAVDSSSAVAVFAPSVAETASATDSAGATAVLAAAVAESANAQDSTDASVIYAVAVAEVANAVDAPNATAVMNVGVSESANAQDAPSAGAQVFNDGVSESVNAQDSASATVVFAAAVTESANAQDAPSAKATWAAMVVEAVSAQDAASAAAVLNAAVAEAASAQDSASATSSADVDLLTVDLEFIVTGARSLFIVTGARSFLTLPPGRNFTVN